MRCVRAWCPKRLEQGVGSPKFGVTDDCELPCGCWELNPGLVQEQYILLTAEPSLQLLTLKMSITSLIIHLYSSSLTEEFAQSLNMAVLRVGLAYSHSPESGHVMLSKEAVNTGKGRCLLALNKWDHCTDSVYSVDSRSYYEMTPIGSVCALILPIPGRILTTSELYHFCSEPVASLFLWSTTGFPACVLPIFCYLLFSFGKQ